VSAATANQGRANDNCPPLATVSAGWNCADPIGDITGEAGPDITRVTYAEWGSQSFRVSFAKGSPLTHSATFTDKLSLYFTAGKTRYVLTTWANHPGRAVLRLMSNGKPVSIRGAAAKGGISPNGRLGRFSYCPHVGTNSCTGGPGYGHMITRWRIKATRVMLNGTSGSNDYAPDNGWYR
jgi:hypothetical protein